MPKIIGNLEICGGKISSTNEMTFEDSKVTPPVTLERLTEDYHAGLRRIEVGQTVVIREHKEMRVRRMLTNLGVLITEGILIMD